VDSRAAIGRDRIGAGQNVDSLAVDMGAVRPDPFRDEHPAAQPVEEAGMQAHPAAVVADGTVLMAGGTSLTVNGARIVSSDTPATVLKTGNRFHCSFDRPATLRIASAAKISSVAVNGKSSGDWSYDRAAGTVTIKLSAGDHAIELK